MNRKPLNHKPLNHLMDSLLGELNINVSSGQKNRVMDYLKGLDELNLIYFMALYRQKTHPRRAEKLRIDDGSPRKPGELAAYPTAIAPKDLLERMPYVHYEDLLPREEQYRNLARGCRLWVKKTQAGGGTSILRRRYLSHLMSCPPEKVKIGAKGTDLFVTLPDSFKASLAELQILQSLNDVREKRYSGIDFHDIVSSESRDAVNAVWNKASWGDPQASYAARASKVAGFSRFGETYQWFIPTLDEAGQLTLDRSAPGGHALFAVEALLGAYQNEKRPGSEDVPLVSVIGNGEDLGSGPDPVMVGWMLEQKAPIAMITTEKTQNDLKGGQIALVKGDDGLVFAALIEQAQAKEAGQAALFEALGLDVKNPGQIAFFNTNIALFNYDVLTPKIKSLVDKIGEEEFLRIITPTLIENKKNQKDSQGKTRVFEQLEGAMGSTLLNLDRYWRAHFGEPLVHFINVGRMNRTRFFSPVKTAFDFFMLFHSDRFELEVPAMRLKNLNPGHLPSVSLEDPLEKDFYAEVQNVLDCFEGTGIRELESLSIRGKVSLKGLSLRGRVRIESEAPSLFALGPKVKGEPAANSVLQNKKVLISKSGDVKITDL